MKPLVIGGIVLIVLGLALLITGGLTYTKNEEKADLGPVDISVQEKKHVKAPTGVAVAVVVAGVALLVVGSRRGGGAA